MKTEHHFVKRATAFLDTIGHSYPGFDDQYHAAEFWTGNQEAIAQSIANFSAGNKQVAAGLLRDFGTLSRAAIYLNELKTTE